MITVYHMSDGYFAGVVGNATKPRFYLLPLKRKEYFTLVDVEQSTLIRSIQFGEAVAILATWTTEQNSFTPYVAPEPALLDAYNAWCKKETLGSHPIYLHDNGVVQIDDHVFVRGSRYVKLYTRGAQHTYELTIPTALSTWWSFATLGYASYSYNRARKLTEQQSRRVNEVLAQSKITG